MARRTLPDPRRTRRRHPDGFLPTFTPAVVRAIEDAGLVAMVEDTLTFRRPLLKGKALARAWIDTLYVLVDADGETIRVPASPPRRAKEPRVTFEEYDPPRRLPSLWTRLERDRFSRSAGRDVAQELRQAIARLEATLSVDRLTALLSARVGNRHGKHKKPAHDKPSSLARRLAAAVLTTEGRRVSDRTIRRHCDRYPVSR